MENKSTDDNSINLKPTENKVVCRKCGGPHFTIKCGKDKKQESDTKSNPTELETKTNEKFEQTNQPVQSGKFDRKHFNDYKGRDNNNNDNKPRFNNEHRERRPYFKTTYRVKISELPVDMTEEEMMELTCDWGHVVKVRVLNYPESSTAYVDFGYEDEANYFIKAIDKTPFEYILISATIVDSTNYYNKQAN